MTGKVLRGTLLEASKLLTVLGMALMFAPSDGTHMSHVIGTLMIVSGAIVAFFREQVKEEQLTKVFVQKKDLDSEEKPPNP